VLESGYSAVWIDFLYKAEYNQSPSDTGDCDGGPNFSLIDDSY
jgi:hypothetical protein